jgi:Spx/MgsR family transcriptional regulator
LTTTTFLPDNAFYQLRLKPLVTRQPKIFADTVIVYGREGCPMCADAKQWLTERKIAFTFREIFEQPLSREELMAIAAKTPDGFHELYAPKGARKVGLPEDGRTFSPDQIVNLQVANPDLIRYPLFEFNDRLIFGFHEATRDALMAIAGESR